MPTGSSGPLNSIRAIDLNIVALVVKICHRFHLNRKISEARLCNDC
jgi:hypothetical protein